MTDLRLNLLSGCGVLVMLAAPACGSSSSPTETENDALGVGGASTLVAGSTASSTAGSVASAGSSGGALSQPLGVTGGGTTTNSPSSVAGAMGLAGGSSIVSAGGASGGAVSATTNAGQTNDLLPMAGAAGASLAAMPAVGGGAAIAQPGDDDASDDDALAADDDVSDDDDAFADDDSLAADDDASDDDSAADDDASDDDSAADDDASDDDSAADDDASDDDSAADDDASQGDDDASGGGNLTGQGDGTCPSNLNCPSVVSDCGCYNVAGLGDRKATILNAGAREDMIAAAMMETEDLKADGWPKGEGDGKSGDSYNAGICKQNWGMIRECHPAWQGLGQGDYRTSAAMTTDLVLDVEVYNDCRDFYGDRWMGGHRNGWQGLRNANTSDIQRFITVHDWTLQMLEDGHMTDNVRFWATVPAIIQ